MIGTSLVTMSYLTDYYPLPLQLSFAEVDDGQAVAGTIVCRHAKFMGKSIVVLWLLQKQQMLGRFVDPIGGTWIDVHACLVEDLLQALILLEYA